MNEIFIGILMISGSFFILVSSIGLVKMPDIFLRMSATTKAATLGTGLTLISAALFFGETGVISRALIIIVFLYLTAPIAAHMIGRAAYFDGVQLWEKTSIDELKGHYDPKTHKLTDDTHEIPEEMNRNLP